MPSQARERFQENAEDVTQFLTLHGKAGGTRPGRRNLEVLNKSGVVLVSAIWEAFCEDLADEALSHLIKNSKDPEHLPKALKKRVAKEIASDRNELAAWSLAGEGWKRVLTKRAAELRGERNRYLNTPKTENIEQLFRDTIGLEKIASGWAWSNMPNAGARKKLDEFVVLRGEIAHRGAAASSVRRSHVERFLAHIGQLVPRMEASVNDFVTKETGKALF